MSTELKEKEITTTKAPSIRSKSKAFEEQKKKDLRMVRGMFKNNETVGGRAKFIYYKYADFPQNKFDMNDGEIYTIPFMVAQHLNDNCAYRVHENYSNEDNQIKQRVGSKIQRYSFIPLEFGEDLSPSNVITVERV